MHVGFEPLRIVLTPTTSLALGLEPVGTLGARGGMALGGAPQGFVRSQGGAAANAPVPDVYAAQSEVVRVAVAAARARSAVARRDHTVGGWEAAAAGWDSVGTSATGAAAYDARFQSLSALRAAARIAPTPERRQRLRSALAAFLAQAPRALPERATAERWLNELAPRAPK